MNDRNRRLYDAWQAGDKDARHALILANARLAESMARRYAARGFSDPEDARQAAYAGLIGAVDRWEPSRGVLAAIARKSIRHQLRLAAYEHHPVAVPTHLRVLSVARWGETGRGRAMLAAAARPRVPASRAMLAAPPDRVDLDAPARRDALLRALASIPEAEVLRDWYGVGRERVSQVEIARRMGRSKQRVHQLVASGLARLRGLVEDAA